MNDWKYNDIGKVVQHMDVEGNTDITAIIGVSEAPNTIVVMQYPFGFNSRAYLLGLRKEYEKENSNLVKETGDWCLIKELSGAEIEEVERMKDIPRRFLED